MRNSLLSSNMIIKWHFSKNFRYILLQKYSLRVSAKLQTDLGAVVRSGIYYWKEVNMTPHQSENITELAKALLNVERTVQPIVKDAENPFTKSWYASLNSVMDACRGALNENGIWLCQYPVPVESPNSLGLVTKLTHAESGQWQSSLAVVPLPKADPQGMGSAMTYARRVRRVGA